VRSAGIVAVVASLGLGALACNQPGPAQTGPDNACARTAERLASFELGPTASTNRVPTVAKHRAACEAAQLTAPEHGCIANAKDTWTAIACVPRMFPGRTPVTLADCKRVIERTRAAVASDMPAQTGSAGAAMLDKMMDVMERSCTEDGWPESVRTCVLATRAGDLAALQKCNTQLPAEMQQKLEQRMAAEVPR
jgi:hypothetical protein